MIPIISLERIEAEVPRELELLRQALRDSGVFYLDARGVLPPSFCADLFEQSRRFFALPEREKQSLDLAGSSNYRGYVGMGLEHTNGIADLKESFEFALETQAPAGAHRPPYFALYGGNQWPDERVLPKFQETCDAYSSCGNRIACAVLKALALSLGQPVAPTPGRGLFGGDICSFSRLIYYSNPRGFSSTAARLEAHTDHALLTTTLQNAPGLEVQCAGEWIPVALPGEAFVVFAGELMEFWTRGYFHAMPHRVHNSALQRERMSIASFFLPDLRNTVAPIDSASCPHFAHVNLSLSRSNSWLARAGRSGVSEEDVLRPIVIGEKEWERINAIFPIETGPARTPEGS